MRSFLSLDLPDVIRDPLDRLTLGLRAGRPVPWENLHTTLVFLGDVSEAQLEDLHGILEMLQHPSLTLRCRGLDCAGPEKARFLALEIAPDPDLMGFQGELEGLCRRVGIKVEKRRFRPHVTLARFRRRMPPEEQGALARYLATPPPIDIPDFTVTSFSLQGSELTKSGARYEALAVYPLRA